MRDQHDLGPLRQLGEYSSNNRERSRMQSDFGLVHHHQRWNLGLKGQCQPAKQSQRAVGHVRQAELDSSVILPEHEYLTGTATGLDREPSKPGTIDRRWIWILSNCS